MSIRNLCKLLPALVIGMTVALPLPATAQDGQQKESKGQESKENDDSKKDEDKTRKLEVFELKHREPQQFNQIIRLAEMTSSLAQMQHAVPGQARLGQSGVGAPRGRVAGYRGATGGKDNLVTAVNVEEKILFVRGTDDQIKKVKELVEAFDVENKELKRHEYKDVRLIPVQSSSAPQIQSTLSQLNLQGQLVQMGEVSLVVFRGDDTNKQQVEQAEQVIEKLNAQVKDSSNSSDSDSGDK